MMKKGGILVGVACAGACAIPLLVPVLAGASLATAAASLSKLGWEAIACGALALVAVAVLSVSARRPRSTCRTGGESCRLDGSCGCRPGAKAT
jgi:ABC-type transport system involved in cytochrome c biogenesis permease component